MNTKNLIKIVDSFKGKKICIIGDLMLDRYIFGDVERISPEAPIPIVKVHEEFSTPGGAGNVANNIAALGGNAFVIGALGYDQTGEQLFLEFNKRNINTKGIAFSPQIRTVEKTRILARGQHVIRLDREGEIKLNNKIEKQIVDFMSSNLNYFDCFAISDYSKGLLTRRISRKLLNIIIKSEKPLIIDTKPHHAEFFKDAFLFTPNLKEAEEISGIKNDILKIGKKIQKRLNCNVLITQGSHGMTLFEGNEVQHFSAKAKEVFDVAGAGDTVVAGVAISLASGADLKTASYIANHAAGIVVGKVGTATCSIEELKRDLIENGS